MKKIIYFLVCAFFFYLGNTVSNLHIGDSRNIDDVNFEKVKSESHSGYVLYKLNANVVEGNHLKGQVEGFYSVFVEDGEGKKSKMFRDSKEVIQNGQDYFLKLKDISFLDYEKNVNEYIQIKLIEEMNMKLILSKN